jgi:hypothetical protein
MGEVHCQPGRLDAAVARHRAIDSNLSRCAYQCDVEFTMASRPVYSGRFAKRASMEVGHAFDASTSAATVLGDYYFS